MLYSNIYPTRCKVTQFILSGNCSTCFGWYLHPSSGEQTSISTESGICQTVTATCHSAAIAAGSRWYLHPSSEAQTTISTESGICHTVTAIAAGSRWYLRPSSGAQTTVSTESGICHTVTAIAAGSSNGVTNTRLYRYSWLRS